MIDESKPKIYVEIEHRPNCEDKYKAILYLDEKMEKRAKGGIGVSCHSRGEALTRAFENFMRGNFEIIKNSQEQGDA